MKNLRVMVIAVFVILALGANFALAAEISEEKAEHYGELIAIMQEKDQDVAGFQKRFDLPITGEIDEETVAKIDELLNKEALKIVSGGEAAETTRPASEKKEKEISLEDKQKDVGVFWAFLSKHGAWILAGALFLLVASIVIWGLFFNNRKGGKFSSKTKADCEILKTSGGANAREGVFTPGENKPGHFCEKFYFSLKDKGVFRYFKVHFTGNDERNVSCPTRNWMGVCTLEQGKAFVKNDIEHYLNPEESDYYSRVEKDSGNTGKETNGKRIFNIISKRLAQRIGPICEFNPAKENKENKEFDFDGRHYVVELQKIGEMYIDLFVDGEIVSFEQAIDKLKNALGSEEPNEYLEKLFKTGILVKQEIPASAPIE